MDRAAVDQGRRASCPCAQHNVAVDQAAQVAPAAMVHQGCIAFGGDDRSSPPDQTVLEIVGAAERRQVAAVDAVMNQDGACTCLFDLRQRLPTQDALVVQCEVPLGADDAVDQANVVHPARGGVIVVEHVGRRARCIAIVDRTANGCTRRVRHDAAATNRDCWPGPAACINAVGDHSGRGEVAAKIDDRTAGASADQGRAACACGNVGITQNRDDQIVGRRSVPARGPGVIADNLFRIDRRLRNAVSPGSSAAQGAGQCGCSRQCGADSLDFHALPPEVNPGSKLATAIIRHSFCWLAQNRTKTIRWCLLVIFPRVRSVKFSTP